MAACAPTVHFNWLVIAIWDGTSVMCELFLVPLPAASIMNLLEVLLLIGGYVVNVKACDVGASSLLARRGQRERTHSHRSLEHSERGTAKNIWTCTRGSISVKRS